ncbi:TPA: hypothetical protein ACH3X1_012577 [Trebouxia sp. C0004]
MASSGTCTMHGLRARCNQSLCAHPRGLCVARRAFQRSKLSIQPFRLTTHWSTDLQSCRRTHNRKSCYTVAATAEIEITVEEDTMERMERSLESVTSNFASIRTGRATPTMLDRVKVDYYGAPTPLKTLAGISAPESTMLVVQPYDKSAMQAIEKAIMQSDIGATPSNDGNLIRINIPALTADRRKEMTKSVAKLGEDGKVSIRNVRREAMKQVDKHEKDGDISEDEKKSLADSIQELTDDYVKQIDKLAKAKQDELSKI